MSESTSGQISVSRAARGMLKSIELSNKVMGTHGGGTLRHILWLIASGAHTYVEIASKVNRELSQVSRTMRTLHDVNYNGKPGLSLIEIDFDRHNPRVKLVELNAKGWALLRAEYKAISGQTMSPHDS